MMLLISITYILYNKLLEVLDYNFFVIKLLIEKYYSNLTELGIFHKILEDNNINKSQDKVDSHKMNGNRLLRKFYHFFTIGKKSDSINVKAKNSYNTITESLNFINNQSKQILISEVSNTPCLNILEESSNQKVENINLKQAILSNKNLENHPMNNKMLNNNENDIKALDQLKIIEYDEFKLEKINNINNDYEIDLSNNKKKSIDNENHNKLLLQTQQLSNTNKINIKKDENIIEKIQYQNNSNKKEEIFSPKVIFSNFFKICQDSIKIQNHFDIFENRNFHTNNLKNSFEESPGNIVSSLIDLVKFSFQKIVPMFDEKEKDNECLDIENYISSGTSLNFDNILEYNEHQDFQNPILKKNQIDIQNNLNIEDYFVNSTIPENGGTRKYQIPIENWQNN